MWDLYGFSTGKPISIKIFANIHKSFFYGKGVRYYKFLCCLFSVIIWGYNSIQLSPEKGRWVTRGVEVYICHYALSLRGMIVLLFISCLLSELYFRLIEGVSGNLIKCIFRICCKSYKIIFFYLQVNCNKSNYVAFLVFSCKANLVAPPAHKSE